MIRNNQSGYNRIGGKMQEIIEFLQGIFLGKNSDKMKIGLTQFKAETVVEKPKKAAVKSSGEIKLSDLMRGSY